MIKFSFPTNFDEKLLNEISVLNKTYKDKIISEVYGSLPKDIFGSGRPYWSLPKINNEIIKEHIDKAHKLGIKFNYILNTPCTGNLEYTKGGIRKIIEFLDYLKEIKVDVITLSIPFLIELIANRYNFSISTSVICNINSPEQVKYHQELGAERITLDFSINREFQLLTLIRKNTDCELELILNDTCLINCPLKNYHYAYVSHISRIDATDELPNFDPIYEKCILKILREPEQLIKSPWIRPEDIKIYEKLGINYFKIAGREANYKKIMKCIKAYMDERLDGNLSSILSLTDIRYKNMEPLTIFIDNNLLDSFINFFIDKKNRCYYGCINCDYCDKIAQKVLRIDEKLRQEYINTLERRQKELFSLEKEFKKEDFYPQSITNKLFTKISSFKNKFKKFS